MTEILQEVDQVIGRIHSLGDTNEDELMTEFLLKWLAMWMCGPDYMHRLMSSWGRRTRMEELTSSPFFEDSTKAFGTRRFRLLSR